MPVVTLSAVQFFFLIVNVVLLVGLGGKVLKGTEQNADVEFKPYPLLFKLSFSFLLLSSVFTVLMKNTDIFQYQLATMVLLYVNFSACLKVCKADIKINERKMGLYISIAVCMCVALLFVVKPGGVLTI